jgi:hypothetical protein
VNLVFAPTRAGMRRTRAGPTSIGMNNQDKSDVSGKNAKGRKAGHEGTKLPPADPAPGSPDVTYQPESGMPRPEPNQGDRTVANDD